MHQKAGKEYFILQFVDDSFYEIYLIQHIRHLQNNIDFGNLIF